MSNQIPVFPLGVVSYGSDRAITNPADVMNHLNAIQPATKANKEEGLAKFIIPKNAEEVKEGELKAKGGEIKTKEGEIEADIKAYFHAQTEDPLIHRHRFNIGQIEVVISHNIVTKDYALQVYVLIPLMGHVLVGATTGNLKNKPNAVYFYYGGGTLSGYVYISPDPDGEHYNLAYKFTAFGKDSIGIIQMF